MQRLVSLVNAVVIVVSSCLQAPFLLLVIVIAPHHTNQSTLQQQKRKYTTFFNADAVQSSRCVVHEHGRSTNGANHDEHGFS